MTVTADSRPTYNALLDTAEKSGLQVFEHYPFRSGRIKGLICEDTIAISGRIESEEERRAVLCEELLHARYTEGGAVMCGCLREEKRIRRRTYDALVGIGGLIEAYENGCTSAADAAAYLGVTEDFLRGALTCYTERYGVGVRTPTHRVRFLPSFHVSRLQKKEKEEEKDTEKGEKLPC